VPVIVAPVALAFLLRRGRDGSARAAAFAALFLSANALLILEVGALMSTPFLGGLLHDRYLFYLVPLWLVLFAVWLHSGAPRPVVPLALGSVLGFVLAGTVPARLVVGESARIDGLAVALWVEVRDLSPGRPTVLRLILLGAAATAIVAVRCLPARALALLLLPVLGVFVANAALAWRPRVADADRKVFLGAPGGSAWVDELVPPGAAATTLWVPSPRCPGDMRDDFIWTEFFNRRVTRAAHVGDSPFVPVNSTPVSVGRDGTLRIADGSPLRAAYVIAPPGVRLQGHVLGSGTKLRLRLWRVTGGDAVMVAAATDSALEAAACAPTPSA
jgi:hypothetical protein